MHAALKKKQNKNREGVNSSGVKSDIQGNTKEKCLN